jgi:hypothetical protein
MTTLFGFMSKELDVVGFVLPNLPGFLENSFESLNPE